MATTGYTRQATANIANGLPIQSADINNELNQVQSAFDNTTGHDHSGSASGTGQKINLTTGVTGVLPIANGGTGGTKVFSTKGGSYSTVSTTYVMSGYAARLTPAVTGNIIIAFSGMLTGNSTSAAQLNVQLCYSTGSSPVAGSAVPGGTAVSTYNYTAVAGTSLTVPLSIFYVASGLTVGVSYWADLSLLTTNAAVTAANSGTIYMIEF